MASARHNFQLVKTILLNNFSVFYIVPGAEGFMYLSNITIRAGYTTYFVSYQGKSDDIKYLGHFHQYHRIELVWAEKKLGLI